MSGFKLEIGSTSYASPYAVSTSGNIWIMGIVTTEMPANLQFTATLAGIRNPRYMTGTSSNSNDLYRILTYDTTGQDATD